MIGWRGKFHTARISRKVLGNYRVCARRWLPILLHFERHIAFFTGWRRQIWGEPARAAGDESLVVERRYYLGYP